MDVNVSKRFRIQLRNKIQLLISEAERDCENKDDPEERLELKSVVLEKAYVKTAEEVLGYGKVRRKPWISAET